MTQNSSDNDPAAMPDDASATRSVSDPTDAATHHSSAADLGSSAAELAAVENQRTEVIHSSGLNSAGDGSTSHILKLVRQINQTMDSAIDEINDINARTKLLALNARIEAARAGEYGAAFGVVAAEMQKLAGSTSDAANLMASQTHRTIHQLFDVIGSSVRGTRLSDLALVNIDLVDRNLYERTCDVCTWASDATLAAALSSPGEQQLQCAADRLGNILSANPMYADLVLIDPSGGIVANGRPHVHRSAGRRVDREIWFSDALNTDALNNDGQPCVWSRAHRSPLAGDHSVLIFATAVRAGATADGEPVGVLGLVYDWGALARSIVLHTPLASDERESTRVLIADDSGMILADSFGRHLNESISLNLIEPIHRDRKGFMVALVDGERCCVGYADGPGYQSFSTGWNSLIIQPMRLSQ